MNSCAQTTEGTEAALDKFEYFSLLRLMGGGSKALAEEGGDGGQVVFCHLKVLEICSSNRQQSHIFCHTNLCFDIA